MPYSVDGPVTELGAPDASIDGVDSRIVNRIRAILDIALHPQTPQPEAERAMRLAQRELHKHQLDRARVMLATSGRLAMRGTRMKVKVRSDTNSPVPALRFMRRLATACAMSSRVKWYVTRSSSGLLFVFYGIATQARVAAETFARYFDAIAAKYAAYDVDAVIATKLADVRRQVNERAADEDMSFDEALDLYTKETDVVRSSKRVFRDSYRDGIVDGIFEACRAELKAERVRVETLEARVEKARRVEEARRARAALERDMAAHALSQFHCDALPEPFVIDVDFDIETAEREIAACRALSLHTESVAKEVLETNNIKFTSSLSPTSSLKFDTDAYESGRRDGKRMRKDDDARLATN